MKLCNFASFDPSHVKRNVSGLAHAGRGDRQIWDEFNATIGSCSIESQKALARNRWNKNQLIAQVEEPELPQGPTESLRMLELD